MPNFVYTLAYQAWTGRAGRTARRAAAYILNAHPYAVMAAATVALAAVALWVAPVVLMPVVGALTRVAHAYALALTRIFTLAQANLPAAAAGITAVIVATLAVAAATTRR